MAAYAASVHTGGPATRLDGRAAGFDARLACASRVVEKIASDTERNHWLSASEALAYGLVGRIVERAIPD